MNVVLMKHETDCEVAAIATACQVSYEDARDALGWRKLPLGAENPVFGNPLNLHRALIKLGFWKRNITANQIMTGLAKPYHTVILLKQSPLRQHWVTLAGVVDDYIGVFWGNDTNPKWLPRSTFVKWFYQDGPINEAFEVYKASIWRIIIERVKGWFRKSQT